MTLSREHLRDYLLHAEERAVYRVYPRHMAAELRAGYRSLLRLLVEATLEGEALLHWQLRCPICGATGDYASSLQEAHHETTCATCAATIVPHVDDEIFVTFSVHPALRRLGPHADDPDFQQSMAGRFRPTTGHELLTIQTFRDWAQNQPLPTQESLEVRHVALWFSDLSGSTALYARRGDPRAFQLVRQHFDYLFEAVDAAGGVIVKTLGDSVMAAFSSSQDALRGALNSHLALADFNRSHALTGDDRMILKIGMHSGPSILVTLNERLDYFGQTVNLAARIAGLARAGDIALSQAVYDEPGTAELLRKYPVEAIRTPVKGLDEPVVINRFRVVGE